MTTPINLLIAFALNFLVAFIVVRFIYYPTKKNKKYVFTFLAFNTIFFFVLSLLASTELSVGIGFGLFAIFSMLRYRTDAMPIREMTYLFAIIVLPAINAILFSSDTLIVLLLANGIIVGVLCMLERGWGFQFESSRKIVNETINTVFVADEMEAKYLEIASLTEPYATERSALMLSSKPFKSLLTTVMSGLPKLRLS